MRRSTVGLFLVLNATATVGSAQIVLSQIYGGGGNAGASYRNDFVELFNRGSAAVDIGGWTVQYASAAGSTWDRATVAGTIQPGQYYLVQLAQGNGGTSSLPTPDTTGGLSLSATSGKVALVNNAINLSGSAPTGAQVVDFVGYGDAGFAEGSPASMLSNTLAAFRESGGCTDSNRNSADFRTGSPSPRNSRSPAAPCFVVSTPQISAAGITNAASYSAGAVAPGEIITVFGIDFGPSTLAPLQLSPDGRSITKSLAGARLLFDGVPAPMIYVVSGQLSAIVPRSVNGRLATTVQVEWNGRLSNRIDLPVVAASPGVFSQDASGRGLGAILNQDYQVNTGANPAAKGGVVLIYATGGGVTVPPGEDGFIATGADPQELRVSVEIGGLPAIVLYAGTAPGLVHGVMQINAEIPEEVLGGLHPVRVVIGNAASQPGLLVAVSGASANAGTGAAIDARLDQLKRERIVSPLVELPDDSRRVPPDWLALVSWNIQVGGTSPSAGSLRPPMVKSALSRLFEGSFQVLAAQEIPSAESSEFLRGMMPGGEPAWRAAFVDTTDTMDNGFWHRSAVVRRDSFALLTTGQLDSSGREIADATKAVHPPHVAQFEIGSFDFTVVNVHLTFADGDTRESVRELRLVMDYLDWYFKQPSHDPDVLVCGDFNVPSVLSGQNGLSGLTLDQVFDGDARFQSGERRFAVTVHDPTSRSPASNGGLPSRNYDHCLVSADAMEELIQVRRVDTRTLTDDPDDPEARLTSDHFPIVALFRTRGDVSSLDYRLGIRR